MGKMSAEGGLLALALLALCLSGASACALNNVGSATCNSTNCGKLLGYFQRTSGAFIWGDSSQQGGTNYEYYVSLIPFQRKQNTRVSQNIPMFYYIDQVAAANVSACCRQCALRSGCSLYRYFPFGQLDNFQSLTIGSNSVNPNRALRFNYSTPFPPCWPTAANCPGYDPNNGNERCILFGLNTTIYYFRSKTNTFTACNPATDRFCYPAVPTEVSYTYAPEIADHGNNAANTSIDSTGVIKCTDTSSIYHNRPRSYWGGLCNPAGDATGADDPHFMGGDGVRFDFNGQIGKSFALLSDSNIHINMIIDGYVDPRGSGGDLLGDKKNLRSWITGLSVMWKDEAGAPHTLHMEARKGKGETRGSGFVAKAMLDDAPITVPTEVGAEFQGGNAKLTLVSKSKRGALDMDKYSLEIDGVISMEISLRAAHPLLQLPRESFVHFNVKINEFTPTKTVHGILGQTLREDGVRTLRALEYKVLNAILHGPIKADGTSGAGYLDGKIDDYVTSKPLAADCKFCMFS